MNKLLAIYGCLLLSSLSIADQQVSTVANSAEKVVLAKSNLETSFTALNINAASNDDAPLYVMHFEAKKPISLSLKEIEFIEEEDMELGFDTEDYLPENFNPKKVYFDLNSISYVEEEIELIDINRYFSTLPSINFLNIDVEGLDEEILLSLNEVGINYYHLSALSNEILKHSNLIDLGHNDFIDTCGSFIGPNLFNQT